jgi:hypothetical protein
MKPNLSGATNNLDVAILTSDYFVTLCNDEFFPRYIIESFNEQQEKCVFAWQEIPIDSTPVTQCTVEFNFVTTDPFKNCTFDNGMVASL